MITLHHLNRSRSKRIIWLLEELGVDYQIKAYQRNAETSLAPPELLAIHPLGKSPVIDDDGMVIAESGAIVDYLIETYGAGKNLAPEKITPAYYSYTQWLHFAEGSAILPMLILLFVRMDGAKTNFIENYGKDQLGKILAYLESSVSGSDYLVGNQFTGADIINSFVIEGVKERMGLDNYPNLQAYLARISARPSCQKAAELEAHYDTNIS